MSTLAVVFLVLAIVIVWGGLITSVLSLRAHPERLSYPDGGDDDDGTEGAIIEHDT